MNKNVFYFFIFVSLLFSVTTLSCKRRDDKAFRVVRQKELKKYEHINISVNRYEVDLFSCDLNNLESDLKKIQKKYPPFLDGDLDEPYNMLSMETYLTDISVKTLYEATMERYPDITFLEVQLTDAFRRAKVILPDFEIPDVYTYVSGGDFEYTVKYFENNLIIALDMYLGADYPVYSMWGIPRYITYRMRREQIIVDCMKEIARAYADKYEIKNKHLLDRMIYYGKLLYFTDITLPDIHDSLKIAYTTQQVEWSKRYQGNVWSFFLENEILYEHDLRTIHKFMNEAPFTSTFSKNSPPRIGQFIGWQIVRNCMKNNPDLSVENLFYEVKSTKILQLSKYKPQKK